MTFTWDSDQPFDGWARIDTAVGVLMELFGWEATAARTLLVEAAVSLDMPVVTAAQAILTHCGEGPPRRSNTATRSKVSERQSTP